ncbi:hypothetical protein [Paracoccus sp. PAR01]|uniref:hypothetical protein n=1 Tax=Paracoccus sp. PAR01 TaxID=2769282 RepID=UPI00178722B1|nr:hypothetical protein [Paracoccus sp. PAR01]MBD9528410.1 hypothetical protein [Paracoccus sp. PAR01]
MITPDETRCLNCGNGSPCRCAEPMPAAQVYAKAKEGRASSSMTAAELLTAYDDLMSTSRLLTAKERHGVSDLLGAATFAAAAYETVDGRDGAIIAMMRAFLLALVDPIHPDLDYLRRDPAAAKAARSAA